MLCYDQRIEPVTYRTRSLRSTPERRWLSYNNIVMLHRLLTVHSEIIIVAKFPPQSRGPKMISFHTITFFVHFDIHCPVHFPLVEVIMFSNHDRCELLIQLERRLAISVSSYM